MKTILALIAGFALVAVLAGGGVYFYLERSADRDAAPDKIAALKELRDTGVITQQDYDARVQALKASAPAAPTSAPTSARSSATSSGVSPAASSATSPATSAVSSSGAPAQVTPVSFSSGTRKVEINDPVYQTVAYTMEIPGDWKFAGDIVRAGGCHAAGAGMRYTAQSTDGSMAMVFLPGVSWNWSNSESMKKIAEQQHCPGIDIDTASSFLVNIAVPNIRPKAKIAEVLPLLPEGQAALKDQLEKAKAQNAAMAQQYGQKPQTLTIDGARVHLQYERDGRPVEEMIAAVIDCNESTMAALVYQPAYQRRSCTSRGTTIARAPQGQLEAMMERFKSLAKTLVVNPEWQKRLMADQKAAFDRMQAQNNAQFQALMKKGRDDNDALLARGRAFQQAQQQNFEKSQAADRARQAAIDESAHNMALYAGDRQQFRNPSTGQVIEASNQYNHQWISSDGSTLIQTNDHTFDPNGVVNPVSQSWTELVVK